MGARRATGSSTMGSGSSATAASSGERPVTYCRYWMQMKKNPNAARNWTMMVSAAGDEAPQSEQARVEHRLRRPQLPADERETGHDADDECRERRRGRSSRATVPR